MTMGGFYWRALVQSTNVGAPVNRKDRIIYHEQRWGAQQRVKPTMTLSSRSGEIHLIVLRGGGGERRSRHRSIIYEGDVDNAVEEHQIKLNMLCDVPAAFNQLVTNVLDVFRSISPPTVVSLVSSRDWKTWKLFDLNASTAINNDDGEVSMDIWWYKVLKLEHPWHR